MKKIFKIAKLFNSFTIKNNQKGASAVEFAFVAPVMIAMLFGSVEVSQAVIIDRKVTLAASTIADLVAQGATLDCATLATAVKVTRTVFEPYTTHGNNVQLSVASIAMVGSTPKVEWSRVVDSSGTTCSDASAYPVGSAVSVTNGGGTNLVPAMIPTNGAIILGDARLNYTSLGTSFFPNSITMQERFFLRPRQSDKVCYTGITTSGC